MSTTSRRSRQDRRSLAGRGARRRIAANVASSLGAGSGAVAAEEIFWAIRRIFEAIARSRPLVVVLDDIHWAEPTFLDLSSTSRTGRGTRRSCCCAWRARAARVRPAWGGASATRRRSRSSRCPTSGCDAADREPARLGRLPARRLADRIIDGAEGNPLFVEEMLRDADRRRAPRPRGRPLGAGRGPGRRHRAADDPGPARGPPRSPGDRRAGGDRARRRSSGKESSTGARSASSRPRRSARASRGTLLALVRKELVGPSGRRFPARTRTASATC